MCNVCKLCVCVCVCVCGFETVGALISEYAFYAIVNKISKPF